LSSINFLLSEYFLDKNFSFLDIPLPKSNSFAKIEVKREEKYHFSTIKVDNDDLDVTKGCCIHAKLFLETPTGLKKQKSAILELNNSKIFIYAGNGVGVVTKAGLKIEPNFPAINPIPLDKMKDIAMGIAIEKHQVNLHIVFSVDNGEEIAKQTANQKVGVIGGISILGTRGIVKPISANAYLESIESEISVANSSSDFLVFTLGNTAHDYANTNYDITQVIEIGNFIYESLERLQGTKFKKIIFISSVAKMCKVAQGCKNTHNRFGGIDFDLLKLWIKVEVDVDLGKAEFVTLKAVLEKLTDKQIKIFKEFLRYKAKESFKEWFAELGIKIDIQIVGV